MDRIRTADVLAAEAPSFSDLLLPAPIVKSLEAAGYLRPSPVQHAAIPLTRLGLDVIIQAKAGTGKTLVFAVTMTELIDRTATFPQALVLAPTREVALQAADVITEVAAGTPPTALAVATLIGGLPTAEDERILRRKCHVIVGTPGRILALIQRGALVTQGITMLVLDEADKLLGPDFSDVVNQVIDTIPSTRQILALSATYTPTAAEQLKELMHQPHEVMLCAETTSLLGIAHYYKDVTAAAPCTLSFNGRTSGTSQNGGSAGYKVDTYTLKRKALLELLSIISFHQAVVFCNSKATADALAENLITAGHAAACLSSDKDQLQRISVLNSLRSFELRIVVATDVAARGIDLDIVNLVVNFDLPAAPATLMHRVGRAGRFGTHGTAVSFVVGHPEKDELLQAVASAAGGDVFRLPDEKDLPLGWSAAQLLDVAAVEKKDRIQEQSQVKVIYNMGISSTTKSIPECDYHQHEVPIESQSTKCGGGGNDASDVIDNATACEIISSISLWPEKQGIPFQKPENTWPLQLAELSPAMQAQNYINIQKSSEVGSSLLSAPRPGKPIENLLNEEVAPFTSPPPLSTASHYNDIVKSMQLDLQRNVETAHDEALAVLEQAFSLIQQSGAAGSTTEINTSSILEANTVKFEFVDTARAGGEEQLQEQKHRQRRPLGSAQVTAYTRQVAQEERDHHRALDEEAAHLESLALGTDDGQYIEQEEEEEEEEFDEHGYYKNPRGQQQYFLKSEKDINNKTDSIANIDSSIMENTSTVSYKESENEAAWRQYWYEHHNRYGYWPGGKPTNSTIANTTAPVPPVLQIPETRNATSAAGYTVVTPGSTTAARPTHSRTITPTTATTSVDASHNTSVPLEIGGWSPSQGHPPDTAAVVAACADQGGYVRVPAQILQRYLELEWQQWQRRFFGGGGSNHGG